MIEFQFNNILRVGREELPRERSRMNRVRIKLTKIPEKLSKKGGYRARVLDNGVVDFDEFVQEVVDKSGFRMEPRMLKPKNGC